MTAPGGLPQSWLARLEKNRSDGAYIGEVAQLFQACRSIQEICNVARSRLQGISPNLSGALYLSSNAGEYLENVMTFGPTSHAADIFAPGDCWALRCGRPHLVDQTDNLIACAHTHAELGAWHLCLPLMAQGEALGILYFRAPPGGEKTRVYRSLTTHNKLLFYMNFAETLALAIANIRLRESLQHQAIRDPLTGLFNRRYMQETLVREIQRAARADESVSIVAVDIDHFKRFNDTHGHDAGDAVLRTVSEALQNRTRAGDMACRTGGEEFALVYPGMPTDVAVRRAEAIRHDIENCEISHLGRRLEQVTISVGISVFPMHGEDTDTLMHAADQALYQSKRDGRNCASLASMSRKNGKDALVRLVHDTGTQVVNIRKVAGSD